MNKSLLSTLWLVTLIGCAHRAANSDVERREPVPLPARFIDHRIFVEPVTQDGHRVRLYTDSGGGTQFLYPDAVEKLGLKAQELELEGRTLGVVPIPPWRPDASIPAPLAISQPPAMRDHYLVLDRPPFAGTDEDGFLGQGWFGGRTWTFDYPGQKLLLRADGDLPRADPAHETTLHFPRDAQGVPQVHFGRITIEVDGQPIDVLFDTGATLNGADGKVVGTSFIVESLFNRWRERHPDWRVVEKGEAVTGFPLIEVPKVRVGGYDVGPVWFTFRKDKAFHEYMTSMMDAKVEGAIGGSAFQYLRISVDFRSGRAVFERP